MAARISGTYSRVSFGRNFEVSERSQQSSAPERLSARCTRPRPPLYAARTRCQSPLNNFDNVFRYLAAATVDFSKSERSSTYQSVLRPWSFAVGIMNCHGPLALALERAF